MSNANANLFSDLLVHDMGSNLADGVSQGTAGPDEFRSAPLWGLGQRIFLLHDGRTTDLVDAIKEHASQGSEANGVIRNFNRLTPQAAARSVELPAVVVAPVSPASESGRYNYSAEGQISPAEAPHLRVVGTRSG